MEKRALSGWNRGKKKDFSASTDPGTDFAGGRDAALFSQCDARAMVHQRNHNLALVVDPWQYPIMDAFYAEIAGAVQLEAEQRGVLCLYDRVRPPRTVYEKTGGRGYSGWTRGRRIAVRKPRGHAARTDLARDNMKRKAIQVRCPDGFLCYFMPSASRDAPSAPAK